MTNMDTMNKELYQKQYNKKIDKVEVGDEEMTITFEDKSTLHFKSHHVQDCCEQVYADFSVMKYHIKELESTNLFNLVIKGVEEMGFLLCFENRDSEYGWREGSIKVFIPCYNSQNGYYSSLLDLVIVDGNTTTTLAISEFVEDNIN